MGMHTVYFRTSAQAWLLSQDCEVPGSDGDQLRSWFFGRMTLKGGIVGNCVLCIGEGIIWEGLAGHIMMEWRMAHSHHVHLMSSTLQDVQHLFYLLSHICPYMSLYVPLTSSSLQRLAHGKEPIKMIRVLKPWV